MVEAIVFGKSESMKILIFSSGSRTIKLGKLYE